MLLHTGARLDLANSATKMSLAYGVAGLQGAARATITLPHIMQPSFVQFLV